MVSTIPGGMSRGVKTALGSLSFDSKAESLARSGVASAKPGRQAATARRNAARVCGPDYRRAGKVIQLTAYSQPPYRSASPLQQGAEFIRSMGLWWEELMTSFREVVEEE